jgi:hypothetical protein
MREGQSGRSTQVEEEEEFVQPVETEALEETNEVEEETPVVPRANVDQTMKTDHATLGSSTNARAFTRRFIDGEELDRISLELEKRRSDHSRGSLSRFRREASDDEDRLHRNHRAPSPSTVARDPGDPADFAQLTSRPAATVTSAHAFRRTSYGRAKPPPNQDPVATPFPQIRGGHLETLFFSAPEHNAKTCTVCHRRRRRPESPSWIPRRTGRDMRARVEDADEEDEDEGFVEGTHVQSKGKQREHVASSQDPTQWRRDGERDGLPLQTVLARVLRELEDDFTHYKRSAF